jgi:ubiquitin C-terminal hydrolase
MVWREQHGVAIKKPEDASLTRPLESTTTESDEMDARSTMMTQSASPSSASVGTFGLVNVGAICWFNSLIQALMSVPQFISLIKEEARDSSNAIVVAFDQFIAQTERSSSDTHNVSSILVALTKTLADFGSRQEDAHEGFHLLIDRMSGEIQKLFESAWCVDLYCDQCKAIVSSHERCETMIQVIMERDFIPVGADGDPFVQYMSGHMTPVVDYKCPRCVASASSGRNIAGKAMRIARLLKPADILVVSFNKYTEKWQGPAYPEEMSVSHMIARQHAANGPGAARYVLVAAIRHMGNMHGGHYNAVCRRNGRSVMFDDAGVGPGAWKACPEDYMLIYARK